MDLPSFLWLWKIAAWSMGLSLLAYLILGATGGWLRYRRQTHQHLPSGVRSFHGYMGLALVGLVLLLLIIGLVGTLGHYGSLGHSTHLSAGLAVVALVLLSATSASQISPQRPWMRTIHLTLNIILFWGLAIVSWTGWTVVQKYLP
ncbi:MAG: DUF4079 domain-containing protein [Desertifilum sp. SIO1I2]|nr:DUF4079 domain-containing protein [Desertifilum sp. SIO1I2]